VAKVWVARMRRVEVRTIVDGGGDRVLGAKGGGRS